MKFKTIKKSDLIFSDHNEFSLNEDRSFVGVAYSGNVIKGHPFWGNLAFEISSMSAKPRIPILFNHDMEKIVGSGKLEFTDKVMVNGTISNTTQYGQQAFDLIKNEGFPMQESVYIEPESIVSLQPGSKATVNGQEIEGPGTIFKGGKIKEVSLTPLGADSDTSTTIFNQNIEVQILEENQMDETMTKFTELYATSPDEAFKFACSCQEKEKASDDDAKAKKIEDLEAQIATLTEELAGLKKEKKEKASLERKSEIEKVFKEFSITLLPDLEESYLEMSDEKFGKVIESLKKDAQAFAETKKKNLSKLTNYEEPGSTSDKPDENKVFALAKEIREKNSSLGVAASLEEARKQLTVKK